MNALTRAERETVLVWTEADEHIRIQSSSPSQIAKLRKDSRILEVPGRFADGETVEFTIAVDRFTLTKGAKRQMSDEEREKRAETRHLLNA